MLLGRARASGWVKFVLMLNYVDAHGSRSSLDGTNRGPSTSEAVQVRHLDLGDLFHLLRRDLTDLGLMRFG